MTHWHISKMLLITVENIGRSKQRVERVINEQFQSMECAICCETIDDMNKGVVYITCGGMADLEHIFCKRCDDRFKKQDPYKRSIEYRFDFPFLNDDAAEAFVAKSRQFVLNEGDDSKIKDFEINIKQSNSNGFVDLEVDFDLFADKKKKVYSVV